MKKDHLDLDITVNLWNTLLDLDKLDKNSKSNIDIKDLQAIAWLARGILRKANDIAGFKLILEEENDE